MGSRRRPRLGRIAVVTIVVVAATLGACGSGRTSSPPPPTWMVGGNVTGLGAGKSMVLRLDGGGDLAVAANGAFSFPTRLPDGAAWLVAVGQHPAGQHCAVSGRRGTIRAAAVTDVAVRCQDDGSLDGQYGPGGQGFTVHAGAAGGTAASDLGEALVLDRAGRALVAGYSADAGGILHMALWRLRPDGSLDTTFNGTGFTTHPGAASATVGETIGGGVAEDAAGRIVVSGYSIGSDNLWGVAVWRFTADGALDTTFAGTGFARVTSPQGGGVRCALDASGRILVAGFTWNGANWDTTVWRFASDGTLDATFAGGAGMAVSDGAAGGAGEDIAVGVALDGSGRILLAGYSTNLAGDQDLAVWRYLADGTLDATFAGTGVAVHGDAAGGNGNDVGRDIAFDAGGRILVAGWSPSAAGGDDMALWRFTAGGALDTTFAGTGFVTQGGAAGGSGADEGRAVAVDAEGRVVVVGSSLNLAGDSDLVVWRYLADGTPDAALGGAGRLVLAGSAGGSGRDGARDLALDEDGRLLLAGYGTNAAGNIDLVVWRLYP